MASATSHQVALWEKRKSGSPPGSLGVFPYSISSLATIFTRSTKDTGPLIGYTGAFAGIVGSVECERAEVRSAAEGTFQDYTVSFTGNWKPP